MTTSEPNSGSAVSLYRIIVFKIDFNAAMLSQDKNASAITTAMDISIPVVWKRSYELQYTLDNLDADTTYRFQVQAINGCGGSLDSEPSEEITFGNERLDDCRTCITSSF